ncbi:hypothetical protein [Pedobacter hiemivivus]|uniref:Uncharacterized protein n=1 Tax=Pedobacter hiemivivus TaxID=2530454 RepID=A0A4R0NAE5_9SPHI|nr:hypothetical protein [Pedobacter hiemivivus]TCC97211.1 hypothetical protein EZ444_10195 [Pedobacter hiemivivus]
MIGLLPLLTSWLAIIGGVWSLFSKISEVANKDLNLKVKAWIQNVNLSEHNVPIKEILYEMFVGYFGVKHFSLKCFFRSALYSTLLFLIIGLLSGLFTESLMGHRVHRDIAPVGFRGYFSPHFYIWLTMIFQDFISLYFTRLLLRKILNTSVHRVRTIVFISFLLTLFTSILFAVFFYKLYTVQGSLVYAPISLKTIYALVWPFRDPGMFYAAIYLGTLWIIIIQSAGAVARLFFKVLKYFDAFRGSLDVQEKPIKSLGAILVLVITLIYIIISPIVLILDV